MATDILKLIARAKMVRRPSVVVATLIHDAAISASKVVQLELRLYMVRLSEVEKARIAVISPSKGGGLKPIA